MKEKLISSYNNTKIKNEKIYNDTVYKSIHKNNIIINFIGGAFVEIIGNEKNDYLVEFIDNDTNETIHSDVIKNNNWVRTSREWFTNWYIRITSNGELLIEYYQNFKNKTVYISFESKSLGDTIAWFPYVEEFRKKHDCKVIVSTYWNSFFEKKYKLLNFVTPGTNVYDIYAHYKIGIFGDKFDNFNLNKRDIRKIPLQQICTDILGLQYKELKPIIYNKREIIDDLNLVKYVCISEHSTAKCKYWNNENGWQEVVDYLNNIGYKVIVLSKENTNLKNVVYDKKYTEINTIINILCGADFFIGVSSGLSWLSWALNIPVIMISGFTKPWNEFNCNRIFNKNVCNGCWHDFVFDKGNWNWCPTNKDFECTKSIKSPDVISEINALISPNVNTKYLFYVHDSDKKIDFMHNNNNWSYEENYKIYYGIFQEIFYDNCYAYNNICKVKKGDVVVDIGANIGIFERYAYLNGAKNIYCYEPEKNNFDILQKNISDITIAKQYIISDVCYPQVLYLDKTIGGHSIYNNNINNTKTGKCCLIQSKTLNNIFFEEKLDKIDFLKIDAEGAELKIINSITDENLNKINRIVLEYHDMIFDFDNKVKNDLVSRLNSLGFNSFVQNCTTHLSIMYFWK